MENFKQQIIDILIGAGFEQTIDVFNKTIVHTQPGAVVNINGRTFQQPGQQIKIDQRFEFKGPCTITDTESEKTDESLMCRFYVSQENSDPQIDTDINFYPDEIDLVKTNFKQIFGIN